MNVVGIVLGVAGTGLIYIFAAWAGPKVIRAMYPEDQHERMIKMFRVMVIIGLGMVVLAVASVLPILFSEGGLPS